jgi:cytochrome P450
VGKTLGTIDPPRHDILRRVVVKGFTPEGIEASLPALRVHARRAILELRDRGHGDLVGDFSRPVLYTALGRLLGLDEEAAERGSAMLKPLFHATDGPTGSPLPGTMAQDIYGFLSEQLAKRKMTRGDDLFSALLDAKEQGEQVSEEEIVANLMTVFLAGNASIGHFFPNLMHALWLHPDQRKQVRDNPSLIDATIEEGVRWDTSTTAFARHIMKDVEVQSTLIPADSRAILLYGSANHDERAIANANLFNIHRPKVRHFGFGSGPHFCLGAPTARAMLRVVLEEILPIMGDYECDLAEAQRVQHIMVRGFTRLPVRM